MMKRMMKRLSSPLNLLPGEKSSFNLDIIYGDWRLHEISSNPLVLKLVDLIPTLKDKSFKLVKLDEIAWKGFDLGLDQRGDNCPCCNGIRFKDADSTIAGILLEGTNNPAGRKYRCIDGKHRIEALLSYELKTGIFYKLTLDEIKNHLMCYNI